MHKRRESRWQMAIQPLTGACFSIVANVVFIFLTGKRKHHFDLFVKGFFRALKIALSDLCAMLN
jgi:hypothetical protein